MSIEAVRLSGIDTRPIKLAVFTLSGALAAVAGISYCAQLSAADPNAGSGFELAAIVDFYRTRRAEAKSRAG